MKSKTPFLKKTIYPAVLLMLLVCLTSAKDDQTGPSPETAKKGKPTTIDSIKKELLMLTASLKKTDSLKVDSSLTIDSIVCHPTVHRNSPGFGDRLVIYLRNTKKLSDTKKDIILYIDNYPLKHLKGQRIDDRVYNFSLINDQDTAFWTAQFLNAKKNKGQTRVSLAIGTLDGSLISNAKDVTIEIYRENWMIFSWIFFIITSILVIILGSKSNILRETCDCQCSDKVSSKKRRRPFSLARTQMAFWTTIVSFAILYIYFVTGYMPEVSNTTLVLLGISASTTVFGYLIDNNADSGKVPGQVGDPCCSLGFFRDLVSDNGVPGIHRFQNIIFTVLLGVIYFYKVSHNLQMTEFSTNLLLLMGISSGAYVGVKFIVSQPSNANKGNTAGQAPPQENQ